MVAFNIFFAVYLWQEADRYKPGSGLWWSALLLSAANAVLVAVALNQAPA